MMIDSVIAAIKRYNMIDGENRITVALSGGADSVALLSCLLEIKDEFGLQVSAAHLNHCLRGEESDRDERFVRELCAKLKVPLVCERADIKLESAKNGESIELVARKVRYAFLERVSEGLIATAHTANDNIETVLHNMARGTGIAGLCGIPPKRGRIIRPLINVSRREIESYCAERELSFCVDSTNSDESYTRNRIRHSIVPRLCEVNSNAVENTALMSATLREDADFIRQQTDAAFLETSCGDGLHVQGLKEMHPALRSRCIARLYEQRVGKTPENRHIAAVSEILKTGGRTGVQNGWSAVVKNGRLRFLPPKTEVKLPETAVRNLPMEYQGLKLFTDSTENIKKSSKFNNLLLNNAVDCDKICGKLVLRGRLPGDAIKLRGRNCTKTFKKLFNESKTDEGERDRLPVLTDDEGVVWLCGFGVAERCAVTENTVKVLVIDSCRFED